MIEARDLCGTCPNRGCTPKKILVAAAHALDEISRASFHHIKVAPPILDWSALIAREKGMISGIPDRLQRLMDERGIDVLRGEARFAGPNIVSVGGRMLKARPIVIATGSTPRTLSFPGATLMVTSDDGAIRRCRGRRYSLAAVSSPWSSRTFTRGPESRWPYQRFFPNCWRAA